MCTAQFSSHTVKLAGRVSQVKRRERDEQSMTLVPVLWHEMSVWNTSVARTLGAGTVTLMKMTNVLHRSSLLRYITSPGDCPMRNLKLPRQWLLRIRGSALWWREVWQKCNYILKNKLLHCSGYKEAAYVSKTWVNFYRSQGITFQAKVYINQWWSFKNGDETM